MSFNEWINKEIEKGIMMGKTFSELLDILEKGRKYEEIGEIINKFKGMKIKVKKKRRDKRKMEVIYKECNIKRDNVWN